MGMTGISRLLKEEHCLMASVLPHLKPQHFRETTGSSDIRVSLTIKKVPGQPGLHGTLSKHQIVLNSTCNSLFWNKPRSAVVTRWSQQPRCLLSISGLPARCADTPASPGQLYGCLSLPFPGASGPLGLPSADELGMLGGGWADRKRKQPSLTRGYQLVACCTRPAARTPLSQTHVGQTWA